MTDIFNLLIIDDHLPDIIIHDHMTWITIDNGHMLEQNIQTEDKETNGDGEIKYD